LTLTSTLRYFSNSSKSTCRWCRQKTRCMGGCSANANNAMQCKQISAEFHPYRSTMATENPFSDSSSQ